MAQRRQIRVSRSLEGGGERPATGYGEPEAGAADCPMGRLPEIPNYSAPVRNVSSCFDRTGCWSFFTALASIWRTRSRVTRKMRPTSSSV